tara:strand:- start:265 stop:399 length:135 start_codon:yes stop_codon:yes gene_type:complete
MTFKNILETDTGRGIAGAALTFPMLGIALTVMAIILEFATRPTL